VVSTQSFINVLTESGTLLSPRRCGSFSPFSSRASTELSHPQISSEDPKTLAFVCPKCLITACPKFGSPYPLALSPPGARATSLYRNVPGFSFPRIALMFGLLRFTYGLRCIRVLPSRPGPPSQNPVGVISAAMPVSLPMTNPSPGVLPRPQSPLQPAPVWSPTFYWRRDICLR